MPSTPRTKRATSTQPSSPPQRVQKRRSPRLTRSKNTIQITHTVAISIPTTKAKPQNRTSHFVLDSASDGDDDAEEVDSEDQDGVSDDEMNLRADHLDRPESLDSRLDPGNEKYVMTVRTMATQSAGVRLRF
jgi:hypothetical protein